MQEALELDRDDDDEQDEEGEDGEDDGNGGEKKNGKAKAKVDDSERYVSALASRLFVCRFRIDNSSTTAKKRTQTTKRTKQLNCYENSRKSNESEQKSRSRKTENSQNRTLLRERQR